MNQYQKRDVGMGDVVRTVALEPGRAPSVILAVSTVRSGSTALLRVFAASGIQSYFQVLKNNLRWLMQGEFRCWQMPRIPGRIFLKETLGPFTEAEAGFNPLQVLLDAGLPREKLHLVILGRKPLETWASWRALWREETRVGLMVRAYLTIESIRNEAAWKQVPTTVMTYELFGRDNLEPVMERFFQRLGLPFTSFSVDGWDKLPPFGDNGSNVILPDEPPLFHRPEGLAVVRASDGIVYNSRQNTLSGLSEAERGLIEENGLFAVYDRWADICRQTLVNGGERGEARSGNRGTGFSGSGCSDGIAGS